jgi:hypothetical protein
MLKPLSVKILRARGGVGGNMSWGTAHINYENNWMPADVIWDFSYNSYYLLDGRVYLARLSLIRLPTFTIICVGQIALLASSLTRSGALDGNH